MSTWVCVCACVCVQISYRLDVELAQRGDLVVHQRDERRDDERDALADEARQLVQEGLAASGGHDDEAVAAGERGVDDLALQGAELVDVEVPCVEEGGERGCGWRESELPMMIG